MPLEAFHPAVRAWFERRFPDGPSAPQVRGWPAIRSGRPTLIASPTGSGKTLAAFLSAIDELVREGVRLREARRGGLPDVTRVLYVSPLKALGNDVRKNLEEPLAGIRSELAATGLADVEIRAAVRTGDTPPSERQAMLRRPPHILVTTPESLFILLATDRGREALQTVRTVIVDEIHAVADDKRGAHLALTLERLDHLLVHGTAGDRRAPAAEAAPAEVVDDLFEAAAPALPQPETTAAANGGDGAAGGRSEPADPNAPSLHEDHASRPSERGGAESCGGQRGPSSPPRRLPRTRMPHAGKPAVRIGLSATQQPIEEVARFLVGRGAERCAIVDEGHVREMDLRVEVPGSPLEALAAAEAWEEVYDRLAELILQHRTTLVFVNTRRLAERTVHHLSKRLGDELVTSHHGSLSRERRLRAEQRLKAGELRALVATASLELGIDIGSVDLVCQIGSPHTIAALVQRVGRSGRRMGALARGRLFALSRDELVECAALQLSVREGLLDRLVVPMRPLDILAQQIVAAGATRDWPEEELFELVRGAYSFHDLERPDFDAVVRMLAQGYATARGRRGAWIHQDVVNGRIRGRRGARLAVVSCGGAIPDTSDFEVVLDPEGTSIGTLNEDFAIESMQGDVFQLGNHSWRILRVEAGRVRVEDAHGQPPSIPFWLGEAPSRTPELSRQVSRVRAEVERRLARPAEASGWLVQAAGLPPEAAAQVVEYLAAARAVLTVVPTQETLVLERFFDSAGGMQLVVHSPFGGRLNRAWGLALRKRFCRSFNFELQAAANEDAIVLSLGPQHSFPLVDVFRYLSTATARDLLVQALLAAPMFQVRWRWNAGRALGVLRRQNGRKLAPQILRMRTEDLLAAAFPQAAACLEHIVGDIEVPDHPLVRQTVEDCLVEAMDIEALEALLGRIERDELRLVARDVPEPSPLAHEILNARPYAFLDDAPAEERRTLAVATRRSLDVRAADELGTLDAAAIERVRTEAWPDPRDADEAHDALAWMGLVTETEAAPWLRWLDQLEAEGRVLRVEPASGPLLRVTAERLPQVAAVFREACVHPAADLGRLSGRRTWQEGEALVDLLRGRMEALGPVTAAALADTLGLARAAIDSALAALESEGVVLRGHVTPGLAGPDGSAPVEWCHRRLLARIHRATVERLRAEIEPVTPAELMRFLFAWQHATSGSRLEGPRGVREVLAQLQGFQAPAVAWERDILPARVPDYDPAWLDALCLSGEVTWARLVPAPPAARDAGRPRARSGLVRASPLAFALREDLESWLRLAPAPPVGAESLSEGGWRVFRALHARGASFLQELAGRTGLGSEDVHRALAELVAWGLVASDGVAGLRALLAPPAPRPGRRGFRTRRGARRSGTAQVAGRWSLVREPEAAPGTPPPLPPGSEERPRAAEEREAAIERLARQLLARYGVLVRPLLEREPLPAPWRELLRVLRRLEMRGEVRGGRFVQGIGGEQFALPEALERLRATRRSAPDGATTVVAAGDPLNQAGILTPGERVAALPWRRVLYRDGVPLAAREGTRFRDLRTADAASGREAVAADELEALLARRGGAMRASAGVPLALFSAP
ncbi:MAG: DEAD/DEAH box helicase [Gemmatimonadota bacterium]